MPVDEFDPNNFDVNFCSVDEAANNGVVSDAVDFEEVAMEDITNKVTELQEKIKN